MTEADLDQALGLQVAGSVSLRRGRSLSPRARRSRCDTRYDNSAGQPAQPSSSSAARAEYGPESTDEMGDLWLQFVARSAEDTGRLAASYREHELHKDLDRG